MSISIFLQYLSSRDESTHIFVMQRSRIDLTLSHVLLSFSIFGCIYGLGSISSLFGYVLSRSITAFRFFSPNRSIYFAIIFGSILPISEFSSQDSEYVLMDGFCSMGICVCLFIFLRLFHCFIQELVHKSTHQNHNSHTDQERSECTQIGVIREEKVIGEIPDTTPEQYDTSTHEERFESFFPELCPGSLMMKKMKERHSSIFIYLHCIR